MTKEIAKQVEEKGMSQRSEDLLQVYKTLAFDLPMASVRWAFGTTQDKESTIAVWKGYDAGVRLATSAVDSLYRSPSLSEVVGNTVNQMLRLQQLSNTVNSFVVTSLSRPLVPSVATGGQTLAAPVDTRSGVAQPGRTPVTTSRRPQRRRARIQEPVSTPLRPFPHHDSLRIAA